MRDPQLLLASLFFDAPASFEQLSVPVSQRE